MKTKLVHFFFLKNLKLGTQDAYDNDNADNADKEDDDKIGYVNTPKCSTCTDITSEYPLITIAWSLNSGSAFTMILYISSFRLSH